MKGEGKMGIINSDDIRGYWFERKLVCRNCVREKELNDLTEEEIITEYEVEGDDLYFCDRCSKQL